MVFPTIEIPRRSTFLVVDVPVCRLCRFFVAVCLKTVEIHSAARRHPCRGADADSHGPSPQSFTSCSTLIRWSTSVV